MMDVLFIRLASHRQQNGITKVLSGRLQLRHYPLTTLQPGRRLVHGCTGFLQEMTLLVHVAHDPVHDLLVGRVGIALGGLS